jgi:hypothetical protein
MLAGVLNGGLRGVKIADMTAMQLRAAWDALEEKRRAMNRKANVSGNFRTMGRQEANYWKTISKIKKRFAELNVSLPADLR